MLGTKGVTTEGAGSGDTLPKEARRFVSGGKKQSGNSSYMAREVRGTKATKCKDKLSCKISEDGNFYKKGGGRGGRESSSSELL